jgi:hypothetical protein
MDFRSNAMQIVSFQIISEDVVKQITTINQYAFLLYLRLSTDANHPNLRSAQKKDLIDGYD